MNLEAPAHSWARGEAVQPLTTEVLVRRSLEFSSSGFITIISIIQSVALGLLARSVAGAHAIVQELTRAQVRPNLGGSVHDSTDPAGKLVFTALAMVAQFEADLARMRTREGMKVAKAKGQLRRQATEVNPRQEAHLVALHAAGERTSTEQAELFGVARSTVYRAVERATVAGPDSSSRP